MSRLGNTRGDQVEYSGGMPVTINSGLLSLSSAVAKGGPSIFPHRMRIASVWLNIDVAATVDSIINIGIIGDTDENLAVTLGTGDAAGDRDLTYLLTDEFIEVGEVMIFTTDGACTAVGGVHISLILVPADGGDT